MPRKRKKSAKVVGAQKRTRKTAKRISRRIQVKQKKSSETRSRKWFKWGESYTSLLLGIVVVIIGVLFIASLVKTKHTQEVTSTSTTTPSMQQPAASSKEMYEVVTGDSLWNISEKIYNSGYDWVKIAQANHLTNPGSIDVGQKLIIPTLEPSLTPTPTTVMFPTQSGGSTAPIANPQAITSKTYIIQKGDNLWDIAVRAYADGYKWVDIAHANNLTNPDLIFSGNTLIIPR